jgi:hypothetical protein
MKLKIAIVASFFLSLSFLCNANADLVSTFDTNNEGWSVFGDATAFTHVGSGGNPGGYIKATDVSTGAVWGFQAPTSLLGDWTYYLGGLLEFDINLLSANGGYFSNWEVEMLGGTSGKATWDSSINPTLNTWTHYAVGLNAGNFTVTGDTFENILGNVTQLRVRGEYISGSDTEGLDNFQVSAVPEPGSMLLLGSGLVGLAGFRRRSRKS